MIDLINGDALGALKNIPSNSVDCIITSPPYYKLRDYGVEGQIGLEDTPIEYIKKLGDIFDEAKRVLKEDGNCFVVIGDTYSGNKKNITDTKNKNVVGSKVDKKVFGQPKSLMLIPHRFAIEMFDRGWIVRNEIIWHKPNAMPQSVKDRFPMDFEHIFLLCKSPNHYFKQVKIPMKTKDKNPQRGSKSLKNLNSGLRKQDSVGRSDYKGFNSRYKPNEEYLKSIRSVWSIPTSPSTIPHFAMFPEAIVSLCAESGCKENGTLLDMFSGSGTVGVVAKKRLNNYIGIEINSEYVEIQKKRLNINQLNLFE